MLKMSKSFYRLLSAATAALLFGFHFNYAGTVIYAYLDSVQYTPGAPYPTQIWPAWNFISVYDDLQFPKNKSLVYDFVREIRLPMCESARYWVPPNLPDASSDIYDPSKPNFVNTSHYFFKMLDSLKKWNIKPWIQLGAVPRALSKNRGYAQNANTSADTIRWYVHLPRASTPEPTAWMQLFYNCQKAATLSIRFNNQTVLKDTLVPRHTAWDSIAKNFSFPGTSHYDTVTVAIKGAKDSVQIDFLRIGTSTSGFRQYEAEFANVLKNINIRHAIGKYSCGRQGTFGWNLVTTDTFPEYHRYIRGFFKELLKRYTKKTIESWTFDFFNECNHTACFDAALKQVDPYDDSVITDDASNLTEYKKLYDTAWTAMQEGLKDSSAKCNLGFGSVNTPYSQWMNSLCSFIADSIKVGAVKKPRLVRDTIRLGHSLYFPLSPNPRDWLNQAAVLAYAAVQPIIAKGKKPVLSVSECGTTDGNPLPPPYQNPGRISNDGASVYAQAFKTALDLGYCNLAGWFYKTWGDSMWSGSWYNPHDGLWNGKRTAAYNAIDLCFQRMQWGTRLKCWQSGSSTYGTKVDALCCKKNANMVMLLLNNYDETNLLDPSKKEPFTSITVFGLRPKETYTMVRWDIDSKHNNFFPEWMDSVAKQPNGPDYKNNVKDYNSLSAPMSPNTMAPNPADPWHYRSYWISVRDKLHYVSPAARTTWRTDSFGMLVVNGVEIEPNSVCFIEIKKTDISELNQ